MRFVYTNYFDSYTVSASNEDGNYPASNLQDSRLSKVWRTTSLTSQTATIDSGTGNTLTPTFAALLNTNFSTGATIKIQGSSSSGFTSSTELSLSRVDADFVGSFLSLSAKRFWRFLVKDTGSTDTYMRAGRAWLGTYITLGVSVEKDFPEELIDSSIYSLSYSGQHYGDAGVVRKGYNLKIPYLNSTQKTALETFLVTVKKSKNFITIFNETSLGQIKPVYGFKSKDHAYKHIYNNQWECNLQIEESK